MSNKNYVTYEEFGAVGDGVADDFAAIYKAHEYANESGLAVKASDTYGANESNPVIDDANPYDIVLRFAKITKPTIDEQTPAKTTDEYKFVTGGRI